MDALESYLHQFEQLRLSIEGLLLRLPQSAALLGHFTDIGGCGAQGYLHMWPNMAAAMRLQYGSPRTVQHVTQRMAQAGPPPYIDGELLARVLMCFSIARFYRNAAQATGNTEFASHLAVVACLSVLDEHAVEQVNWIMTARNKAKKAAGTDWLAPALLFVIWLTNMESPAKARQMDGFLAELNAFVDKLQEHAAHNTVCCEFPW